MKDSTILVTGGAGFIGSHVAVMLDRLGVRTLIYDRLINSTLPLQHGTWIEGDLADLQKIKSVCSSFKIDAVMHFAALIDVGESVVDPAQYYNNNLINSLNLFEAMRQNKINSCIFSSSAAIFGKPELLPIPETHSCHPINPYGESKLMVEKILKDFDVAYGLKSSALRYFNAAGGDPEGKIRNKKLKESNLIPIALKSIQQGIPFTVYGVDYPTSDGSCIRDYIHVQDIGNAHILALEKLLAEKKSNSYNLGNGRGYSVWEVIHAIEKVTGQPLEVIEGRRRAGDVPILLADSTKARLELNWQPHHADIETMVQHAWMSIQQ